MRDNMTDGEGERFARARALAEKAVRAQSEGDDETADRLFAEASRIDPQAVEAVLSEAVVTREAPPPPASDEEIAAMSRTVQPHSDAPSRAGITRDGSGADDER
jgi:hypothetical protein